MTRALAPEASSHRSRRLFRNLLSRALSLEESVRLPPQKDGFETAAKLHTRIQLIAGATSGLADEPAGTWNSRAFELDHAS
jgi:hypothetical protein